MFAADCIFWRVDMVPPSSAWKEKPPKGIALRKFTSFLNHITKLRNSEEINNIEFRRRYWTAVRQFVKKNGWIPL
jgi:hypothetical protein